jgi:hypothetical protein
MGVNLMELRIKGKPVMVPSICVEDRTVLVFGKWIKMAVVHDENWVAGEVVKDPETVVAQIRQQKLKADFFTFPQRLPDSKPRYKYPMEWDNVAAIPLSNYSDWWEKRIPQESRKNVRRSVKRGVTVRTVPLDDQLIQGIADIYNETPVRQGKPFPKYGQDFQAVKKDVSQILDRSEFICAYAENEMIGFVKLVFLGQVASILSINSKNRHFDKRPTNALMAKAIEVCCEKGMSHLLYGRYTYGNKASSPLTEFKRRNGFEKILLPRYYVPLTLKGRIILRLNLHLGLINMLPGGLVDFLVKFRAWLFEKISFLLRKKKQTEYSEQDGNEASRQAKVLDADRAD